MDLLSKKLEKTMCFGKNFSENASQSGALKAFPDRMPATVPHKGKGFNTFLMKCRTIWHKLSAKGKKHARFFV
ncbi:MAG: hypothetical protein KH347_01400 [Acetobacter sp.]|nr:hypothetical protein [Acetobacter sp.]